MSAAWWRHGRIRAGDRWRAHRWRGLPHARLVRELDLGSSGGDSLFVADINGDGRPEFLWLQSAGIFKSDLFARNPGFRERNDPGFDPRRFCLTATDSSGHVLWQQGTPYGRDWPSYVSHVSDEMVAVGDFDADGQAELGGGSRHAGQDTRPRAPRRRAHPGGSGAASPQ